MWFTLLIIVASLIAIPIGILVLVIVLLILMPIHIGASGYYREDDYAVTGWAKAFAGLVGVVFDLTEAGGQLQIVLGKWVIWQPQEETDDESETQTPYERPLESTMGQRAETGNLRGETTTPNVPGDAPKESAPSNAEPGLPPNISATIHQEREALPQIDMAESKKTPAPISPTPDAPIEDELPSKWVRLKSMWGQFLRYLDYWDAAQPILIRFIKRLVRILSFRYIDIQMLFGASDPAQTGRLFGYVEAIRPLLKKQTKLILTPDFQRARLEGAGALEVSFHLSRLLWALLALAVRGGILGAKIWWRERQIKRSGVLEEV